MSDLDFYDELQLEANRVSADGGNRNNEEYIKKFVQMPLKEGEITVRLLPRSHGMKLPFQATRLHKVNGKSLHCRKELVAGKWQGKVGVCPICDHYNWLWSQANAATGSKADEYIAIARAIKPIERFYYNCIVRADKSQSGNKILSVGKKIHQKVIQAFVGDVKIKAIKRLGDVTDTTGKEGRDLIIVKKLTRSGGEEYPNYDSSVFLEQSPLGSPEEVEQWLAGCYDLSELRILRAPEELKRELQIHLGIIQDEATGYDPHDFIKVEDRLPTPVGRTSPAVTKTVQDVPFNPDPPTVKKSKIPEEDDQIMSVEDFMRELGE
jgi:hypothetical protein